jgi:hypothetical protein
MVADAVRREEEADTMTSDFLFARPSFLSGMATAFDISGRFHRYNTSRTPLEADTYALVSDHLMIEEDLRNALIELLASDPSLVQQLSEALDVEHLAPIEAPLAR